MKDGLALIHKIWSDLKGMFQKGCECKEGEMEKWKQNWDKVFMDKMRRERRERRERER
jgi:hypothetical protein